MLIHNLVATGSLSYNGVNISYVTGSQTSLDGLNQFSASVNTTTGSLNSTTGSLNTATGSLFTASGSFSTRVTKIEGNYATTGSNVFLGAQTVCANITSTGTIIAQTLNVQQVTSSIVYSSGSNIFGCSTSDVQQFTGSVRITGSLSTVGIACFSNVVCTPQLRVSSAGDLSYIYNSGASTTDANFYIYSATKDILMVRNSGCIGIGTANPTKALEIVSNTSQDGIKISGTSNPRLTIVDTTNSVQFDALTTDTEVVLRSDTNHPLHLSTNGTLRLNITNAGIACFACQTCAPGMDIMPSGIGVSTLGGIMRVVTTGTSTGIAVGQSNANRYTHFGANDIQVFNDDFFLTTRCAFPLSIGTCYTARLTFAATGVACFSCRVCTPAITITGCSTSTIFEGYNQNTDDGNGLYIKAGGVNTGKYIMALESAAGCSRMIVLANGNVGIGTTSPRGNLDVSDGNVNISGEAIFQALITGGNRTSTVDLTANLTIQTNDAVAANKGGSLAFGGRALSASTSGANWAGIAGLKTNGTSADYTGYLQFWTRGGSASEKMRITSDGNILFNGTSDPGGIGNIYIGNTGSVPGTPSGGGVLYVQGGALKFKGSSGTVTTIANA